jgi:SAM-dependent methyltransferase
MESLYTPETCDLCDSKLYSVLLSLNTGRSMRSDRRIINRDLEKFTCGLCGLVRSGQRFGDQTLADYYADEYTVSEQDTEYYFHTPRGVVSRSSAFCDWIVSAMGEHRWRNVERVLEIGAGSGSLMQEFSKRFPETSFEGTELNKHAAARAKDRGLIVHQGSPDALAPNQFDLVYTIAVLEHVPSPTRFLREIRRLLRPGGWLFLCQPTQDVPSYDVFFADHLHHFGTEHLHEYARKCGFRERGMVVGHELMPNFSLHLWSADEEQSNFSWKGRPGYTTCQMTARQVVADMKRLDETLEKLAEEKRRVAAFGLNEVYWLARGYSTLGDFHLTCGLDDTPDKPEYQMLEFPVVKPETSLTLDVQDVLLTMNKIYYDQARRRLEQLGLQVHRVLS